MTLVDILHMNTGDDDSSYANNSSYQQTLIRATIPYLKRTIKRMANHHDAFFDRCFMIADLGCSSGVNSLLAVSIIIETIHEECQETNHKIPQFQVCLNDLFGNDFNNLFGLLPNFYKTLKKDKGESFGSCFVSAIPGSFYDRLFPEKSMHLFHSSSSLHWLSQVPQGLEDNKLNIHIAKTSPLNVVQAYGNQFLGDFTRFLRLRSEELVSGGYMVLTIPSRRSFDPTSDHSCNFWELLALSLLDLLKEGIVRESEIISFNLPLYFPHEDELKNIIEADGSFSIDNIYSFEVSFGEYEAKDKTKIIRAITEPLFISHFGKSIIEVFFKKLEKRLTDFYVSNNGKRGSSIVVSLIKK